MAELQINLSKIRENITLLDQFFLARNLQWTLVMKVLAGCNEYIRPLLKDLNLRALSGVADSRLVHLVNLKKILPDLTTWQIRPPALQNAELVAEFVDVSCNSSLVTLKALNIAAGKKKRKHKVLIMVELGENREGVLPGELPAFFDTVMGYPNLEIIGLGTNLGCLYGVEPTREILEKLVEFKKRFETEYRISLSILSGGSSINLPMVAAGEAPGEINHYRIGEAAFFGTTPYDGKVFQNLSENNFQFSSSVLEVYDKDLEPTLPLVDSAVGETLSLPAQTSEGVQAVLDFGLLDADPKNLIPHSENHTILGASSDMATLYDSSGKLKAGQMVHFHPDYMGVARLMVSATIKKNIL